MIKRKQIILIWSCFDQKMSKVYRCLYNAFGSEKSFQRILKLLTWFFSSLYSPFLVIKWALSSLSLFLILDYYYKESVIFAEQIEDMGLLDFFK